jgi:hypothetical protein
MKIRHFLKNEKARIPFSVIGVFLILGSSFTTVYVTKLESDKSLEVVSTLDFNEIEQVLRYVEADIARSLGYAGMHALKTIGTNPVSTSEINNSVTMDYADFDSDGTADFSSIDIGDLDTAHQFNINWARNITRVKLNEYLETNFMNNRCRFLNYIVNVKPIVGSIAVNGWRDISLNEIVMHLDRAIPDSLEGLMITEKNSNYATYYQASVDIEITLTDVSNGETRDFTLNPCCIITSRLPIMMGLTETFTKTINGVEDDLFGNKLCILVTLISEGYTEARALIQWSQGPTKIKNIVDNEWLKYVINAGLVTEEFMVFNSVDPISLFELARKVTDLTSDDKTLMDQDGGFSFIIDDDMFDEKFVDGLYDDLNQEFTEDEIQDMIENPECEPTVNMIQSVQEIAEDLLYKVDYTYYYHRVNEQYGPVDRNGNPAPPGTPVIKKQDAEGYKDKGYIYTDPDDSDYSFLLGKPGADTDDDVFDRVVHYDIINDDIKTEIETKIAESYDAYVSVDVTRNNYVDIDYESGWTPDYAHGDELVKTGDWVHDFSVCNGNCLQTGDTLPVSGYSEEWTVTFRRTDEFDICTDYDDDTNTCNESVTEDHDFLQSHQVTFNIKPNYPGDDVDSVFNNKNNIFNMEHPHDTKTRNDDNLKVVLTEYPDFFITNVRDDVLQDYDKNNVDNKIYQYDDGANYQIKWLQKSSSDKGSIVEALEHIITLIIEDEDEYSQASNTLNGDSNTMDDMDAERQALLNIFLNLKDDYIHEELYHINKNINDEYISTGSKTVSNMCKWFIDQIQKNLEESPLDQIKNKINEKIGDENADKLQEYEEIQNGEYSNVMDDIKDIGNGQGIQIGLAMNLERQGTGYQNWDEQIAFAVDRYPDYFEFNKPKDEDGKRYKFNVKNTCLFGPTGFPLLPIPPIPWFCTINLWIIDVDGSYEQFKLVDTLDETHADPLFGHDGQVMEKKYEPVYDWDCSGEIIGRNQQIPFKFWTMNFAIVPPNRLPIGDQGEYFEEDP